MHLALQVQRAQDSGSAHDSGCALPQTAAALCRCLVPAALLTTLSNVDNVVKRCQITCKK